MTYYSGADPGFPRGDAKLLFTALFTKPPYSLPPYRTTGGRSCRRLPLTANGHFCSTGIVPGKAGNGSAGGFVNRAVNYIFPEHCKKIGPRAGADPGFLVGGGANIQICQIFPKNCMKLRKFWSVGGALPLGSATGEGCASKILLCRSVTALLMNEGQVFCISSETVETPGAMRFTEVFNI